MSNQKFHFLLTSMNAHGPVNATMGFGELLTSHGHKVTFTHLSKFRAAAEARNFDFISFDDSIFINEDTYVATINANPELFRKNPLERFKKCSIGDKCKLALVVDEWRRLELALSRVIDRYHERFDAFVHDWCDLTGSLFLRRQPVISLLSSNPLLLYHNGPPHSFGLSTSSDKRIWSKTARIYRDANAILTDQMNRMLEEFKRPPIYDPLRLVLPVKTIGFYHYPADLDYSECVPKEKNWFRIDCLIRPAPGRVFAIPQCLINKPGKLIYLSLGSTASNDLALMRKVIDALSKAPHRFIVSKGYRGDQLELPDNMWGENYVDQIAILQVVDLVITHGGNNTLMETLYYGKPMIVIPYFFDQPDNAQRVVDKRIGYRMDPWSFNENRLLDYIESILNDNDLQYRVREISQNMKNSYSGVKSVRTIEMIISESINPSQSTSASSSSASSSRK